MYRRNPSLGVRFARPMGSPDRTADVLTDGRICEPVISLQKDVCAGDGFCSVCTLRGELFEFSAFFFREIDDVLLSAHFRKYAPKEDNLAVHGWEGTRLRFVESAVVPDEAVLEFSYNRTCAVDVLVVAV